MPKLMGSEGFVSAGITVKEVEGRGFDRVSIQVSPSVERCSSYLSKRDVEIIANATEAASLAHFSETEFCRNSSHLPNVQIEYVSKNVISMDKSCTMITAAPKVAQLHRKAGKVTKNGSSCSKRLRMSQSETFASLTIVEDTKDMSEKLRSHPMKCCSAEKTQLVKQKRNINSKQGLFGLYGLKSDINDITKLVDDPPLNELLNGTYGCPAWGKDTGKKEANMNEIFFSSVKRAFSILQVPKPVQPQNIAEMDSYSHKKLSTCQLNLVSVIESGANGDEGKSSITVVSPCQKDSCNEARTPGSPLDLPIYQPKDVLGRIALPPPRDLESLLLDASKPAGTTRNTPDLRSGKQICRRPSLSPFPWSHSFGGHYRSNSDAVKLSTSRNMCQGRWERIGIIASSMGIAGDCFTNLDSLPYSQHLVPSGGPKIGSSDNEFFLSIFDSQPFCQQDSSSFVFSRASQVTLESGGQLNNPIIDGHCPRLFAAAQTLYELATQSLRQNPDVSLRQQNKPSQKPVKGRKLKSNAKLEERLATSISVTGSDLVRSMEQVIPSKKTRLSIAENRDLGHSNCGKKSSVNWPASRSSRSLHSKSVRD
ncbi:Chromosome segregation in meiosis 3 [Quillaja saponaria]|uniref:Chromosome segregation in meiosis 3 n=1 Tax=Quillaja saponaria TaxID=32244 RepID=A0AAD7KSH1_QUISA|nr:Chromosome segregation in meiosis 3 [Quillaja saponaria]